MSSNDGFPEPEKLWGDTFYGVVQRRPVVLHVKFGLTSHRCALFNRGWEASHFVGMIDGQVRTLKVLKRGWFQTTVLLSFESEPMLLKTSNKFGDMLRPFYGSELCGDPAE